MRDEKRIKRILKLIEKIWSKYPDQRFGQMLINNFVIEDNLKEWNMEDVDLEVYLNFILDRSKDGN